MYRISHPLAQKIIEQCKQLSLSNTELTFKYSDSIVKISILNSVTEKSGWLLAKNLSITTFDTEDHVVLTAITDDGFVLDNEQCVRLFSLGAEIEKARTFYWNRDEERALTTKYQQKKQEILGAIDIRNAAYFDLEIEKLDKWGEDRRNSLKIILKELDEEIRSLKKQARLAPNLPEKLKLEKERKKLESERDLAWKEYDSSAKEIDQIKDKLLDQIEKKLEQNLKEEPLFLYSLESKITL